MSDGIRSYEHSSGRYLHQADLVATLREIETDPLASLYLPKVIDYIEGLGKTALCVDKPDSEPTRHAMLPGTHEWPRTPECRCGAAWDRGNDRCVNQPDSEQS